jgi:tetratricopeptide (TPR) repeat protein
MRVPETAVDTDYLDNPVAGTDPSTLKAIDAFIGGFLGYEPRLLEVLPAADRAPENCLVNVYAGWLWMFLESPEGPVRARHYLHRAQLTEPVTLREKLHLELLGHWIEARTDEAWGAGGELLRHFPRDLSVVKLLQYLAFNRGESQRMLDIALAVRSAADDIPELHGMLAFGFEQCHRLEEAESAAGRGLHMKPTDPWAQHALAHVHLATGRVEESIRFLESASERWEPLTSFMYTHNWWHLGLLYLSEGRYSDALAVFDDRLWTRDRTYSQDQAGAASMLARLELADLDVGNRWNALSAYLDPRRRDTTEPFLSLHYLYALARGQHPAAADLMAAIDERSRNGDATGVWREVALPLALGLVAHANRRYAQAADAIGGIRDRIIEIGGSHAQRDLFEQILIDALVKSGRDAAALSMLERRLHFEPRGALLNRHLATVYEKLGRNIDASAARLRARR